MLLTKVMRNLGGGVFRLEKILRINREPFSEMDAKAFYFVILSIKINYTSQI